MIKRHSLFASIKHQYRLRVTQALQVYLLKSVRDVFLLALEIFVENTMIQIISSINENYTPLLDVGYELLVKIDARKIAYIGSQYQVSVEMLAAIWAVFCFFNGSKGLTVVQKGVRCLTLARTLRMFVFSLTILPSPKPWCRFHGPINPFKILVGGACNDLLYSGHVTVYTVTGISFTILARNYSPKILRYIIPIFVWLYILQRIICTILERHHYSIDMFLGVIVVLLMWQCQWLFFDLPQVPQNLFLHLKQLVNTKNRSILKEV